MLSKMGWDSGKGLGAQEDGMTSFIKTVKRKKNLGKKAFSPFEIQSEDYGNANINFITTVLVLSSSKQP